jgi:hypothetical protein
VAAGRELVEVGQGYRGRVTGGGGRKVGVVIDKARTFKDYAWGGLAVVLSMLSLFGYMEWRASNRSLRSILSEGQGFIAESRPEAREILRQSKVLTFETRAGLKAFIEDVNSPAAQRGRLASMRSGESLARGGEEFAQAAEAFTTDTLPRLNAAIEQANNLLAHSDGEVNRRLLPAVTALVSNTDKSVNQELAPELKRVAEGMVLTATTLNRSVEDVDAAVKQFSEKTGASLDEIHGLLADPWWDEALAVSLETMKDVRRGTKELADSAGYVKKYMRASSRFQKVYYAVNLISAILSIR